MHKYIFRLSKGVLLAFLCSYTVSFAWMIPGTIQTGAWSIWWVCNSYPCDYFQKTCNAPDQYWDHFYECWWYQSTCYDGWTVSSPSSSYGNIGSGNKKLGADLGNSCTVSSVWTKNVGCSYSNTNIFYTSTPNQFGSNPIGSSNGSNSSCSVVGRYATEDTWAPTVTINNGVSGVFDWDSDNWCNMDKYLSRGAYVGKSYGSTNNPELLGCKYYRDKNPNITSTGSVDLLKNLEISVTDPQGSGISSIQVEIGLCNTVYSIKTGISDILASSSSTSVKPEYNTIVIKYNTDTSFGGNSVPGLLQKFGKSRLDECLAEGKNFLRVTAKDSSRSDSDGTSLSASPNTTVFSYDSQSKFIKVDNYGAKLNITGNARSIAESNTLSAGFVGGIVDEPNASQWKNFTISGSIKSADPFGNNQVDPGNMCQVLTSSGMSCDYARMGKYVGWAKPSNAVWKGPSGVNPNTGAFIGYTCDGLGPIPDKNSCDWDFVGGAVPVVPVPTCSTPGSCPTPDSGCPGGWWCNVSTPNRLFILFSSGSANATGPNAAKLTSDSDTSHGVLQGKPASCTVPTNASASTGYKVFKYSATGNYSFPTAPTGPYPIVENGETMCMPTCNAGYRPIAGVGGGSCEQMRVRARWCPLASQNGPTLGYTALWGWNPGSVWWWSPINTCGLWNGSTMEQINQWSIVLDPVTNLYVRCDVLPDTMVDVNQPIPDYYCPATPVATNDWWYVEFTLKKAAGTILEKNIREFSAFQATNTTAPLYQCVLKSAGYDGDGIGVCDITGNAGQDDWKITIRDEWDASAHKCNLVCNYKKYNGSPTEWAPCTVSGQEWIMVWGCCLAGTHWERGAGNGLQKNIISSCDLPSDNCPEWDFSGNSHDGICWTAPTIPNSTPVTPSACQTIQEKVDPVLYTGSPLNIDASFGSAYFGQTATNIPIGTYDDFRNPGTLCQYLGYQSSVSYTCLPACNTQCPGGYDEGGGCMGWYTDACTPVAHRHNGGWFASVNPIGQNYCTYGVKDITCQKKVNCPPPLQISTPQGTCYMDVEGTYNEGDTRIFACRLHSWDNRDNSALGTYQGGQWVLSNQTAWGYYQDPYRDCAGMTGAVNDGTSMGWICPSNTPTPWACGNAQYTTAGDVAPTVDLCSSGTPSTPTGVPYSQYSWTCSWQNGWTTVNCSTQVPNYGW